MVHLILLIMALVCFLLAAANWPARPSLGWIGAFLLTLDQLLRVAG